MTVLQPLDPADVGVDAGRLGRIDQHLTRYVDDGRLAGWQVVVSRREQVVHSSVYGSRDLETGLPVEPDTLWRIYSMTKPITAVAAMALYEQGAFRLQDEVSRYLPEFADMRVLVGGNVQAPKTVPAVEPVRLWHLLTHTAGLTTPSHGPACWTMSTGRRGTTRWSRLVGGRRRRRPAGRSVRPASQDRGRHPL